MAPNKLAVKLTGASPMQSSEEGMTKLFKVPKAVQHVRDKLGEQVPTADLLKQVLSAAELNQLGSAFRSAMQPHVKQAYAALGNDAAKRAWLAQYVIDPKQATCVGVNEVEAYVDSSSQTRIKWLTEKQLAGPQYLNSKEDAAELCASVELDDRLHKVVFFGRMGSQTVSLAG